MHVNARGLGPMWWSVFCASVAALCIAGCGGEDGLGGDPSAEAVEDREAAVGTVYKVGPTRTYKNLGAVAGLLEPGDVVEVDGGVTYTSTGVKLTKWGTPSDKITIRGVRVNGKRPVLSGGYNAVELAGNHYVFEGFEVTGGEMRCVFHHAHDVTIRDTLIRDCPSHGLLGATSGSGSLTMEYVEIYNAGMGDKRHPIYMATDDSMYPDAVFRLQHSYVHDGLGGNNVKSRARRNEVYYNWIEGALYKEIELIGGGKDSDVVGNVFRKTKTQYVARVGGDGTGPGSFGRYRFVNNTFLLAPSSAAAIHVFTGIESIEMHNNVFYRVGGGSVQILKDEGDWLHGAPIIAGAKNWVPTGTAVPKGLTGTLLGTNPGFVDVAKRDVRLVQGSPLVDAGVSPTSSPAGYPFPSPLALPLYQPPLGKVSAVGSATARPVVGAIDIGAYELGSAPPAPPAASCATALPGDWVNAAFSKSSGVFTVKLDVTPSASGLDAAVGLASGAQTTWKGLAAIVRFNVGGTIDVRNGSSYQAAATIPYAAGVTYSVRMVVDVPKHTYSVYVRPGPNAAEQLLASGFAFRTEQASVPALSDWVLTQQAASGSLQACSFTVL